MYYHQPCGEGAQLSSLKLVLLAYSVASNHKDLPSVDSEWKLGIMDLVDHQIHRKKYAVKISIVVFMGQLETVKTHITAINRTVGDLNFIIFVARYDSLASQILQSTLSISTPCWGGTEIKLPQIALGIFTMNRIWITNCHVKCRRILNTNDISIRDK